MVQELKIIQKSVWNHLHKAGFEKKLNVWVPQENELSFPFLKRMLTNEKDWVRNNDQKDFAGRAIAR